MPFRSEPTPDRPAKRTQRTLFAWSLLAVLILLTVLAGPFFAGKVYVRDDLGAYHLPARAFYAQQLARGESFDWMPRLYCGFYLTGEGQVGSYHPAHWLVYRCLPFRAALAWEWLAGYPLMAIGMWLFLRRRLTRSDAAMVGSLLFTFCGFNLLHFTHPNAIAIVAHVPWLLWAIDVILRDPRPRRRAGAQLAVVLLSGSQLLLGYPQYVWFSLLAELAFAAFILAGKRHGGFSPVLQLAGAKFCGLLVGGIQLLPTFDALSHSTRSSVDAAFTGSGSLHPSNLVQLVAPYLLVDRVAGDNTHELGLYAGAATLILAAWAVVRHRRLGRMTPLFWASAAFGVIAMLLAFGKYGPLYQWQSYIPLVGRFRFSCRYIVLFQLALAVMAAAGFRCLANDYARARRDKVSIKSVLPEVVRRRWQFTLLYLLVGISAIACLTGLLLPGGTYSESIPAILAGPILLSTAAVLVALASVGVRPALVGLILFAAADLGFYGLSHSVYSHTTRLDRFVAATVTPPSHADERVVASTVPLAERRLRMGNQITMAGWRRADGYAGLEPRQRLDYADVSALRVASVRWVRRHETDRPIDGLIPHDTDWLEVPDPLPRVRLVTQTKPSQEPAEDLRRIDVESTALVAAPLDLPEAEPGTAELISEGPGRLQIRCNSSSRQLLVVSESYHPGWQAMVQQQPRPVLRVNGDFLGCLVGPGQQEVVLQFRPKSLDRGRKVSYLGLALALLCLVGYWVPHGRQLG